MKYNFKIKHGPKKAKSFFGFSPKRAKSNTNDAFQALDDEEMRSATGLGDAVDDNKIGDVIRSPSGLSLDSLQNQNSSNASEKSPLLLELCDSGTYYDARSTSKVSFSNKDIVNQISFEKKYDGDDDDLSYERKEEEGFKFNDKMLHPLRGKHSIFYTEKKVVRYNDSDHLHVMTQMYGSVWGHVFPFCLINVAWCFLIDYLNDHNIIKLQIPSTGHSFMSILVAFLVVARVQITYGRFMEARAYLGGCFKSCRELMHCVAVLTSTTETPEAKLWRKSVAVQIVTLLRVTVAAIEFYSHGEDPLNTVPKECLPEDISKVKEFLNRSAHFQRTSTDEALRAPLILASSLRKLLLEPRHKKLLRTDLVVPEELKLLSYVSDFCTNFQGLSKLITTPFPFPLVQMSRTILFFWVFTLPMALITDKAEMVQVAVIIFFVTYGFLGLEYVSIELDDPFGEDPNDFNTSGMAQAVYEDMYLILLKFDGIEYANMLSEEMSKETNKDVPEASDNNV